MASSTRTIPKGYIQINEINLGKNKGLAILLNIVGLFISILAFFLLALFTRWIRPGTLTEMFTFKADLWTIGWLIGLIVLVTIILIVHELIHGFFFWLYTRSKPVYALHLAYAYTAAPDWYIPVRQYWIIGIAPLVLIDMAGLLFIGLVPLSWILIIVLLVAFNTGGSVGDLWILFHLLWMSPSCLINDGGDDVTFFKFSSPSSKSGYKNL